MIITGVSGAGKTSVLNVFEDMGYYAMDNLPPQLIINFVDLLKDAKQEINKIAVVTDIRGGVFFNKLIHTIKELRDLGETVSILYLDADDEVLIKRYKELRRKHPLEPSGLVFKGIEKERKLLEEIRAISNYKINTSHLSLGELKNRIKSHYSSDIDEMKLPINIVSFGFKYGILIDADMILDVRFLPNPYYIRDLKTRTGKDDEVKTYVNSFEQTSVFIAKILDLIEYLLPKYLNEGKEGLIIGIGCTGGKHRSVVIAEKIYHSLGDIGEEVYINHRDQRYW